MVPVAAAEVGVHLAVLVDLTAAVLVADYLLQQLQVQQILDQAAVAEMRTAATVALGDREWLFLSGFHFQLLPHLQMHRALLGALLLLLLRSPHPPRSHVHINGVFRQIQEVLTPTSQMDPVPQR